MCCPTGSWLLIVTRQATDMNPDFFALDNATSVVSLSGLASVHKFVHRHKWKSIRCVKMTFYVQLMQTALLWLKAHSQVIKNQRCFFLSTSLKLTLLKSGTMTHFHWSDVYRCSCSSLVPSPPPQQLSFAVNVYCNSCGEDEATLALLHVGTVDSVWPPLDG